MGYGGVLKLVTSSEFFLVTSKAKVKILKHRVLELQGSVFWWSFKGSYFLKFKV